jgi:hypothetical protein
MLDDGAVYELSVPLTLVGLQDNDECVCIDSSLLPKRNHDNLAGFDPPCFSAGSSRLCCLASIRSELNRYGWSVCSVAPRVEVMAKEFLNAPALARTG